MVRDKDKLPPPTHTLIIIIIIRRPGLGFRVTFVPYVTYPNIHVRKPKK